MEEAPRGAAAAGITPVALSADHVPAASSSAMRGVIYTSAMMVSTAATIHPHITCEPVRNNVNIK
eukprot:6754743-Pyramimonas_sp.AAC.1